MKMSTQHVAAIKKTSFKLRIIWKSIENKAANIVSTMESSSHHI